MIPDNIRVHDVVHPRAKRPGMVRVWRYHELVAASCRECDRVHGIDELVANCASAGGYALLCLPCQTTINRARRSKGSPSMTATNYAALQELVLDVIDNSLPVTLEGLEPSARKALDAYALRLRVTPEAALSVARTESAKAVAQARRLTAIADEAYRISRP
jgi:hypothetical protein